MRAHGFILAIGLLAALPGAAALAGVAPDPATLPDDTLPVPPAHVEDLTGKGNLLVGVEPGAEQDALDAILAAGAVVLRTDETLGVHRVTGPDLTVLTDTLRSATGIAFVEDEDAIRMAGAQWNGAQWNGAQWNGAQWNGAQWNGAQWNEAMDVPEGIHDPGHVVQWGLGATQTPPAWSTHVGERRTQVCVLDSGIAWDHEDLRANAWTGPNGKHGHNAIDRNADAYDDAGHGTHMAGIIAAEVGNGAGVAGVGNVEVMAVKVLNADGTGKEGDLAFGLAWCASHGADVALMAVSVTEWGPTLERAVAFAEKRDVLIVASAGNDGPCTDCVSFPARDPRVLAVSAVTAGIAPAPFSNAGGEVDLAAPGVDIASTLPGDMYAYGSGTSQAAAYVAGAAALLRDAEPNLSAHETRDLLTRTAKDIGTPGRDDATGYGLLQTRAALEQARG